MILVLSGTEDGKKLVERLHKSGYNFITSVATEYGKAVFERLQLGDFCIQGRLDKPALVQLIDEKNIDLIIDATHPYAVNVSINAIEACDIKKIKYLRFQRDKTPLPESKLIHKVHSVNEAIETCRDIGKRIMFTTGFNNLKDFVVLLKDEKELIVRVLPIAKHVEDSVKMGIQASNVIALQGPFSFELNKALYDHFNIDTMVTKDSGKTGGVVEKVQAAIENGINIVLIDRPVINYPAVFSSIDEIFNILIKSFNLESGSR